MEKVNELCRLELQAEQEEAHPTPGAAELPSYDEFTPFCTTYVDGTQQLDEDLSEKYHALYNLDRHTQKEISEEEGDNIDASTLTPAIALLYDACP